SCLHQVLSRLDSLSFYFFPGYMRALLGQLPKRDRLQLRIFSTTSLFLFELKPTIAANVNLQSSITHLRLSEVRECELLPFVATNLVNLTSLDVEFSCFCKASFRLVLKII